MSSIKCYSRLQGSGVARAVSDRGRDGRYQALRLLLRRRPVRHSRATKAAGPVLRRFLFFHQCGQRPLVLLHTYDERNQMLGPGYLLLPRVRHTGRPHGLIDK